MLTGLRTAALLQIQGDKNESPQQRVKVSCIGNGLGGNSVRGGLLPGSLAASLASHHWGFACAARDDVMGPSSVWSEEIYCVVGGGDDSSLWSASKTLLM